MLNASAAVRPVSGIGTYTKELIRSLVQIDKDNSYTIFSIKSPFPHKRASFSYPKCENVLTRSFIFPYNFIAMLCNNLKVFPIEKFFGQIDIVHSLDKIAPLVHKGKLIVTIHDMLWHISWANDERKQVIYKQVIETLKRADAIITVSEFSMDEMVRYLPFAKGKICVITSGVSERFRPIDRREIPETIHKKYPWNDYVLYLGTLNDPRKNVAAIVNSYAALKRRGRINEKLVLLGDIGSYSHDLLRLIKKINMPQSILIYRRWVPDEEVPYIYNKARIVLFPSLYEGFGFPILESMACGRPIITSRISPLQELASDAAMLVDPKDEKALANSIEMLLSDDKLYHTMVEKGFERCKLFTWSKTAKETLKLYEDLSSH